MFLATCLMMLAQSNGLGCATDLSEDGTVGFDDLTVVLSQWNTPNGDANQDGTTNFPDLVLVLSDFNRVCHPFSSDVDVQFDYDNRMVTISTSGLADHVMGPFSGPDATCQNPNTPSDQNRTIMLPMDPVFTPNPSVNLLNTLGPVGVAINGVALYNPYDGGGVDAPSTICMDGFKGHPSPDGSYHYHQWSPRFDGTLSNGHSELIGYGYDGFPVFGPWESAGVLAKDLTGENQLDACNGHDDPILGWHYHAVAYGPVKDIDAGEDPDGFPWIFGCFHGEPVAGNFGGGGGGGGGGSGGCNGCAQNTIPPPICNCVHTTPGYESCCMVWTPACQAAAEQFCGF